MASEELGEAVSDDAGRVVSESVIESDDVSESEVQRERADTTFDGSLVDEIPAEPSSEIGLADKDDYVVEDGSSELAVSSTPEEDPIVEAVQFELQEQQRELEQVRAELEEARDRHVRLLAEFENFRRRTLKERSELMKYQGQQLVVDLMDIIDNIERAMTFSEADSEQFRGGVEMIFRNFQEMLDKWGVRLESAVGKEFNPANQSALSILPSPDVTPGTVIGELKKAVFYKDKLIRVGEVVVAGPPQEQ